MTAAAILRDSAADGVTITLSLPGTLKVAGEQAMVSHWLASIREHKPGIIALLSDTPGAVAAEPFAFGAPPAPSLASISVRAPSRPDRNPLTVTCSPAAIHAEAVASYPDALAAEPSEPGQRQPGALLTLRQESVIRAGEVSVHDDRRFCTQCGNLRGDVCTVAKPGGVVSAIVGYRPVLGILQRCAGYSSITNHTKDAK
jgi:hypothetical protein